MTLPTFSRLTLIALVLAAAIPASGATQQSAAALLQQAVNQEIVNGDLSRAIALYKEVIEKHGGDRGVTAQALANLGRAYEKLGAAEAKTAYQRLIRDYADQGEPVRFARGRLQALDAGNAGAARAGAGVYAIVYDNLPPLRLRDNAQYDFSPNGEEIVLRQRPEGADSAMGIALVVTNSTGAVLRTLVPAKREVGIVSPRWSPDGKYIAYVERAFIGGDVPAFTALRIVPAQGGKPITLNDTAQFSGPATGGVLWTPDSRAVTVATRERFTTYGLDGALLRTVQFRMNYLGQAVGYSPDGQWLAFHQVPEGSQQDQMDVWIMPAEGGRAIQLTHSGKWDGWPAWSANGRSVFFVSDRSGSSNVWKVNIDARTGLPQGDPVQITSYTDAAIRYPKPLANGKIAFALIRETGVVRVASVNAPQTNRIVGRGRDPQLSPDGRTVFYVGQGVEPPGIFAAPVEGGTARRITSTRPIGNHGLVFGLSRDGRSISYFTQMGAQNVLFVVPSAGGTPREIVRLNSREHLVPVWSPDGSTLAYSHDNGLYVVSATGGEARKIAQLYRWEGWTVRWSPDGRHIAALAWTAPNVQNAVVAVPVSGGEPKLLTPREETGYKELAEWHPDGTRLSYMYYGHDDRGDGSRYAYLDGRPTSLLVDLPYPNWDYVGLWHPGGRDYYFISSRSGAWDLFAHDITTGASRLIWQHGSSNPGAETPAFSADGQTMTWPTANTTRQLWVIDGVR